MLLSVAPSALHESLFIDIHAGGPEAVFSGRDQVIDGIFGVLNGVVEGLKQAE